jgi:hypothetical protein
MKAARKAMEHSRNSPARGFSVRVKPLTWSNFVIQGGGEMSSAARNMRQGALLFLVLLQGVECFVGLNVPAYSLSVARANAARNVCLALPRMCLPSTTEPPKVVEKPADAPKVRRTRSASGDSALFTPKNLGIGAFAVATLGALALAGGDQSFVSHMAEMYDGSADVQFSKSLLGAFVIGSMSAIIAEAIAFPFDTLKTRLQLEQTKPKNIDPTRPPLTVRPWI